MIRPLTANFKNNKIRVTTMFKKIDNSQGSTVIPKRWGTTKMGPRIAPGLPGERCKATAQKGGPRGLRVEESELRVREVKAARVQGQTTREERMAQGENLGDL